MSLPSGNFVRSVRAKSATRDLTKPRTGARFLEGRNNGYAQKTLTRPSRGPRKIPKTTSKARNPKM